MIRRHGTAVRIALALVDATIVVALVLGLSGIGLGPTWRSISSGVTVIGWTPFVLASLWLAALYTQGLYRLRTRWTFRALAVAMLRATIGMGLVTFTLAFLFNRADFTRTFIVLFVPAAAIGSLSLRALINWLLVVRRQRGGNLRNILIVGSGPHAVRFAHELETRTDLGLQIVGYINGDTNEPSMGWPYLGPIESLADVFRRRVVDEVALCLDLADWQTIQEIVDLCRLEGKIVRLPLAGGILTAGNTYVENLGEFPVLSIVQGPDRELALAVKRMVDICFALIAIVLVSPLLLAIGVAIKLDDSGPILFRHQRVGLHGRLFWMLKFRTMVPNAEGLQSALASLNEIRGSAFKVTADPRVTRVGRWLRRAGLDELPQLVNVLRGDMSLIGPRPAPLIEVEGYDMWHRRRLSMKPGISGLWQIGHRRDDFDQRATIDLEYIDRWSLWLDLKIAVLTVPAMLRLDNR